MKPPKKIEKIELLPGQHVVIESADGKTYLVRHPNHDPNCKCAEHAARDAA